MCSWDNEDFEGYQRWLGLSELKGTFGPFQLTNKYIKQGILTHNGCFYFNGSLKTNHIPVIIQLYIC